MREGGARLDERAAGRGDERPVGPAVPGPRFEDLTDAAGDAVLVALGAGLRVVDRAEPCGYCVALLEDGLVADECAGDGRVCALRLEAVGLVVEGGRRFLRPALALHHVRLERRRECERRHEEKNND